MKWIITWLRFKILRKRKFKTASLLQILKTQIEQIKTDMTTLMKMKKVLMIPTMTELIKSIPRSKTCILTQEDRIRKEDNVEH